MDTIQSRRAKAQASGNLQTTKEQTVIVEEKIIKIEPANPQVVYVPTYNPTVVYGAWPYPAYPPYSYYPPGYVATTAAFSFAAGVAMGAAWGYAWGGCNWNGGDVDVDVNRNTTINNNINRDQAKQKLQERGQVNQAGQGKWQHSPENRKGVSYRDQERQRNSTGQVATTRSSQGRSFADGRTRADSTFTEAESETAAGLETEVGLAIAAERAVKEELAIAEVPVALAIVEGRVIEVARVKSPAVAGPVEGAARSGAGAFEGVDRGGSSARSASQRGSASRGSSGGGGEGPAGAAAREVEAAEVEAAEDGTRDRLVPLSAVSFRVGKMEH